MVKKLNYIYKFNLHNLTFFIHKKNEGTRFETSKTILTSKEEHSNEYFCAVIILQTFSCINQLVQLQTTSVSSYTLKLRQCKIRALREVSITLRIITSVLTSFPQHHCLQAISLALKSASADSCVTPL